MVKKDNKKNSAPDRAQAEKPKKPRKQPKASPSEVTVSNGKDAEVAQEELTDEVRKERVYWAADKLEEEGKYASTPSVQRKLRDKFGSGMSQKFVHAELAVRRRENKLRPWPDSEEDDRDDPSVQTIKNSFAHVVNSMTRIVKDARKEERSNAAASIEKAQKDASNEIARIEIELGDYMEDNERLVEENERLAQKIRQLESLVAEKEALLIIQPTLSGFVEEKIDAIMSAITKKALVAAAKLDVDSPVTDKIKPTRTSSQMRRS